MGSNTRDIQRERGSKVTQEAVMRLQEQTKKVTDRKGDGSSSSESLAEEVESMIMRGYAQQIKEKNSRIVHGQYQMTREMKVGPPLLPKFSSAGNIRDFYIRELAKMR